MVLYGVHPVSLQDRVDGAVEKVRPQVQKQGGKVELLDVGDNLFACRSTAQAMAATRHPTRLSLSSSRLFGKPHRR